jgi:hypothetical protein
MPGRTVSGVIPPDLYDIAQQSADYEGTTMSALVSSALAFYLGLSGAARRSARYVLASGETELRDALLEGCGRAIARAGDQLLTARLAARGRAMGLQAEPVSEEEMAAEAVEAVSEARRARRTGVKEDVQAPHGTHR